MRPIIRNLAIIFCLAVPGGVLFPSTRGKNEMELPRDLPRQIETKVAEDDGLQPGSRKITVTIQNRVVTLKGVVQSDLERQMILGHAEALVAQNVPDGLINSGEITFNLQLAIAGH